MSDDEQAVHALEAELFAAAKRLVSDTPAHATWTT